MIKQDHIFKKQFGQNFFTNHSIAEDIVKMMNLSDEDTVVEIGPGDGRFSEKIVDKVKKLILIEIDSELIEFLKEKFIEKSNVEIINQDILKLDVQELKTINYKLYGSLPYNISKPIISKFLECESKPKQMLFIIQKEVAEDYAAVPPRGTFLGNYAQIFSEVNYRKTIGKNNFHPRPEVDGGLIELIPYETALFQNPRELTKFIKNCFRTPRKNLYNNLRAVYKATDWKAAFEELQIDMNKRPAEVGPDAYSKLSTYII